MRCAYIKYGDVADELEKIGPRPRIVPTSGPHTFIANFLQIVENKPALLISWDNHNDRRKRFTAGLIEAHTYKRPKGLKKMITAAKVFMQLITFQPHFIICAQEGPCLWAAFAACRFLGASLLHSRQRAIKTMKDKWSKRAVIMIDSFVMRRAANVICHGPFARHQLMEIGVPESKIIEFDVRLDEMIATTRDTPEVTALNSKRYIIMFLGRVEATKGVFDLLEATIPILKSRNDVGLTYVGNGSALQILQQRVHNEGLSSRVLFTGAVPHKDVGIHLRSATVLVAPTRHGLEGWGMAPLEGLAMGVPVIAPAAGPFPFMIEHGINGLLFKVDCIEDLRDKIENILNNPGLRQRLHCGAKDKSEERKKMKIKDFGEALRAACAHWINMGLQL